MNNQSLYDIYSEHYNPTAGFLYQISAKPIESHSEGSFVIDEFGNKNLDFATLYGTFLVGHSNPEIQAAVLEQGAKLSCAPYGLVEENSARLTQTIAKLLPEDLNRVFFASSGSEGMEIALRAAWAYNAPRKKLVVAHNSYHGKTLGALNILGQFNHSRPFQPLKGEVNFVPYGDISAMKKAIDDQVAAVVLEPILGGPFLTVPPKGYLKQVAELCQQTETLLIADEIQTGFGRTGKLFAIEWDQVVPDIILLSKAITGGCTAMAVAVVRDEIVEKIEAIEDLPARYLGSDSGGSPLACAAAQAAIEFILEENLPQRAQDLGNKLKSGLELAAAKYPKLIKNAPGIGLMTGLRCRNPGVETAIAMGLAKRKIHVGHSLNETIPNPVLRFYPPLTVSAEEIDFVLEALEEVLVDLNRKPGIFFDFFLNPIAKYQYRLPKSLLLRMAAQNRSK
jgi:putrescine aminotransferase